MGSRSTRRKQGWLHRAGVSAVGAVLCAVVWAAVHPMDALSADPWLKLKTSNFELITTAGERRGRDAILHFEKLRTFFLQAANLRSTSPLPVRIIAFGSRNEYRPYQPTEFTAAFYQPGNNGQDYIVMGSLNRDTFPIAVHEYIHLLVKHSGATLPVWLNEGMAEVYSTLRPRGNKVEVGDVIPGRAQVLQRTKWLDLETLLAVDHDSPLYNEGKRTDILYAQSWILTHMLALSDEYREKFPEFFRAISSGGSGAELFQEIYGKSLKDVQDDLRAYQRRSYVRVGMFDIKLEKSAEEVTTEPVETLESGIMLAELLIHVRKLEEGRKAYKELAAESPQDDPKAAELLGYFAWGSLNEAEEGKRYFARAVELGSQNAKLHLDYAMLLRRERYDDPMVMELLQKAVELQPDLADARYELGVQFYQEKMYALSIASFNQVQQVSRERAVQMYRAMAHGYYELGDAEEALKAAELALQYSRSPGEIAEAERVLEYVSYRPPTPPEPGQAAGYGEYAEARDREDAEATEAPVLRRRGQTAEEPAPAGPAPPFAAGRQLPPPMPLQTAEGTLRQFDCLDNSARVVIDASGQEIKLLIRDPNSVVIRGADSYAVEFTCGEQEPKDVVILYEPVAQEDLGTVGVVRVIEFK